MAIVDSINNAAPHPIRIWEFPGLEKTNYLFRIFEMSGSTIVRQLGGDMDVNPGGSQGISFKATGQIEVDVTTGVVSGTNTFVFDGTGGKQDWRGWDIATIEDIGQGALKRGVDYSWDPVTGTFLLLKAGDKFAPLEWYNVIFEPNVTTITDSVPTSTPLFSNMRIVTANYSVDVSDFGGLIIAKPTGAYIEITLPDLSIFPVGKKIDFEMGYMSTQRCVKIKTTGSDTIDWMEGNRNSLYFCNEESITLYKFIDPSGPTSMWRVYKPCGNFLTVGEHVTDDSLAAKVFNKRLLNGAQMDVLQYARLYNDHVLFLAGQAVNYDDWATGNNKYKFSLANSANPANNGKFLLPDLTNTFSRIINGFRVPGDWQVEMVGPHYHHVGTEPDPTNIAPNDFAQGVTHPARNWNTGNTDSVKLASTGTNSGTENRPANRADNKYVRV